MSTTTLLDKLVLRCPGWSRSSGDVNLLQIVERARDELLVEVQSARMWRRKSGTGICPYPYLLTTDNTMRYLLSGSVLSSGQPVEEFDGVTYDVTAGRVDGVFSTDQSYLTLDGGRIIDCNGTKFYECRIAHRPAFEGVPAEVIFESTPGTTTEKYIVRFTWEPPELISEEIPLFVPKRFERAIEEFVIGYVREVEHGGVDELMNRFYQVWVPEFVNYMNFGDKTTSSKVARRVC